MHYFKPFRPFIVLIFLSTQVLTWGQSFELQPEQIAKMSLKQDIPYFKDSTDFESLYQYLKDLESSQFAESYVSSSCLDEFPFLEAFEQTKNFQSLHSKQMLDECEALALGVAPESLPEYYIPDPILQRFLMKKVRFGLMKLSFTLPLRIEYLLLKKMTSTASKKLRLELTKTIQTSIFS